MTGGTSWALTGQTVPRGGRRAIGIRGFSPADWVLFLDGREREETAVWSTEAAFRESWRRPKWEILLE